MVDMDDKVKGTLIGCDGNAFVLMEHFRSLAEDQEFDEEWIDNIISDAMSGDYDNLIMVLSDNMTG